MANTTRCKKCPKVSLVGSSYCQVHSKRDLQFRKDNEIKDVEHWSSYLKQEWNRMYKSWEKEDNKTETDIEEQDMGEQYIEERDIEEQDMWEDSCTLGSIELEICTKNYPCYEKIKEFCYDPEGESYVYPSPKAGQLSQEAKAMGKLWKQFLELPKDENVWRRDIQFDQKMDRKDFQHLEK